MNIAAAPSYISEFQSALESGIENIVKASAVYVEAIDSDPTAKEMFLSSFADVIPSSAWAGFEAVGRKQMHPKLLFGAGGNRGYLKYLPYSDQEQIMAGHKYDFLISGGDSIRVDPREITKEQVRQLFGRGHVRTLGEQRSYLESLNVPHFEIKQTAVPMPYTISSHKVYIKADTVMTKRDVKRMLEAM